MLPLGFYQTAFHGVALSGNVQKLDAMAAEYKARYERNKKRLDSEELKNITKRKKKGCKSLKARPEFIRKNTEVRFVSEQMDSILIQLKRLKRIKARVEAFWDHLRAVNEEPLTFGIQDYQLNTPLHLAAMKNSPDCVRSLLKKWKSGMDLRNLSGVMAKNMGAWYPQVVT